MWGFSKKSNDTSKNSLNSDEYERLATRVSDNNARISAVEASLKLLQTDLDNLRGKFNRKLKGLEAEEKQDPENEKFNNDGFLGVG